MFHKGFILTLSNSYCLTYWHWVTGLLFVLYPGLRRSWTRLSAGIAYSARRLRYFSMAGNYTRPMWCLRWH